MTQLVLRSVIRLNLKGLVMASRGLSSFLIEDPKYSFLKELGLEKKNLGVYNGKWKASGEVSIYLLLL